MGKRELLYNFPTTGRNPVAAPAVPGWPPANYVACSDHQREEKPGHIEMIDISPRTYGDINVFPVLIGEYDKVYIVVRTNST